MVDNDEPKDNATTSSDLTVTKDKKMGWRRENMKK